MGAGKTELTVNELVEQLASLGVSDNESLFTSISEKLDPVLADYIKQWTDIRIQLAKDNLTEDVLKKLAAIVFALGFVAGAVGYKPELFLDKNAAMAIGAAVLTVARESFSTEIIASAGTDVPAGT